MAPTTMKNIRLLAFTLLLSCLALNAQAQKKGQLGYDEATAQSVEPKITAHVTPVVADVKVTSTRITHSETFSNALTEYDVSNPTISAEINYMKNYTLNRAAKKSNADLIVAPSFEIRTSENMQTITVEVSGYPASYINFRTASDQDLSLIRNGHQTAILTPGAPTLHANVGTTEVAVPGTTPTKQIVR